MTREHVHLGIFERPGADFTLRRTLELISGSAERDTDEARAAMAIPSRFVLLVPLPGSQRVEYLRYSGLNELFTAIGTVWAALSQRGVRHIYLARSVEPETERLIDEAAVGMEALIRPPAANDMEVEPATRTKLREPS